MSPNFNKRQIETDVRDGLSYEGGCADDGSISLDTEADQDRDSTCQRAGQNYQCLLYAHSSRTAVKDNAGADRPK